MVCLSVIFLFFRITYLLFCNKNKGALFVLDPVYLKITGCVNKKKCDTLGWGGVNKMDPKMLHILQSSEKKILNSD